MLNFSSSLWLLRHAIPLLIRPKLGWRAIAEETITPLHLYIAYIVPLTALHILAVNIRLHYLIASTPGIEPFLSMNWTLTPVGLTISNLYSLLEVYLLAIFANGASSWFSGERSFIQALKVIAFSFTSMWIGKIFILIPVFALDATMPGLFTLYSGYLLYLGLSVLMKVPYPRAVLYACAVVGVFVGLEKIRRSAIPALIEFARQWPVLGQGTKTSLTVFTILGIVGLVLFLVYGSQRKVV